MTIRLKGNQIYNGKRKVASLHCGKYGWYIYDRIAGSTYGPYATIAEGIRLLYHIAPEQAISFPEVSNEPGGRL